MPKIFNKDAMQAALGFALQQQSHIETAVNAAVYPDIQYQALIPVDSSAHPFAKTVTYFSSDKFGRADWINGNAGDIPLAGTELAKHENAVHSAGIGYAYGYEELHHAQMLGYNLQSDDAMAARRAYEEMVDRVALYGDVEKNFQGLVNHTAVVAESLKTGDWDTASEDQVLADINAIILGVGTDTNFTSMANTVLLPHEKLALLATRRLGDTAMTILEFIRKNNVYTAMSGQPLTIRAVLGLDKAGTGDTARMIAYRRDPQVLKLHIPMPHRFLPAVQDGPMNVVVAGIFRMGGLDLRRSKEVRYGDGL